MNQLVRITMIAVLVSACGDSTGPKFGPLTAPTPAQQTAIAASSHNLSLIANATTDGQAAASAAINFALTAPSLLPDDSSARTLTEISGLAIEIEDLAAMVLLFTVDDCQVMTDHSVTWNHCVDGDTTVDGTMSWSAGHVDVDVHATATSQSLTLDYAFSGSLTVSDAAIQGDMMVSFTATTGGQTVSDAIHTQLDVELASGCIYRGTLTVTETETSSANGAHNRAVQVVWIGCNSFQVRNG